MGKRDGSPDNTRAQSPARAFAVGTTWVLHGYWDKMMTVYAPIPTFPLQGMPWLGA